MRRRLVGLLLVLVALALLVGFGHAGKRSIGNAEPAAARRATPPPAFERLRERPLRLPWMPLGTCRMKPELSPATANVPGRPGEAALGDGPVYVAFRGIPRLLDAFPAKKSGLVASRWHVGRTVWISPDPPIG